jgi:hypothetical protein
LLAFALTSQDIVQTLISKAIFLAFIDFHLFLPSPTITFEGIFVTKKDVLYNWTSKDFMVVSTLSVPFRGVGDIHAFVEVYFPLDFFIVHLDFATCKPYTPRDSLIDSTASLNVKTMERYGLGARSLARRTLGVEGCLGALGWGLGRVTSN